MKTFVARQPIYDRDNGIFGYELLYRNGSLSPSAGFDPEQATRSVLSDAVTAFGLEILTGGKRAFVNFTGPLLQDSLLDLLLPNDFVIEILENVAVTAQLVACVDERQKQGYLFALDDYIGDASFDALLPMTDIIKVDFSLLSPSDRHQLVERLIPLNKRLLAEKIETEAEYREAVADGYNLFQGYYFARPLTLCADIPTIQSATCVRMFQALSKSELDLKRVAEIVRADVQMTCRLLAHVNTLAYYRGKPVNSILVALMRMGLQELRRWVTLVLLREFSGETNPESAKTALVRGLFAERLAQMLQISSGDNAFLTGMLSMLDHLDEAFPTLLEQLALDRTVRDALLGQGGILEDILAVVRAYEAGSWDPVRTFATTHCLESTAIADAYVDALQYAAKTFS